MITISLTTLLIAIGVYILLAVIVFLTPTEKDNKILGWIDKIIAIIIPNVKKVGKGKYELHSFNLFKAIWKLMKK